MNLLQLVGKQMRQRALSTWLTLLSVILGVTLAVAILVLQREGQHLFAQTDFGYDILIGPPKGSPLQLTLNTVYHLDASPGVVPYQIYEDMIRKQPPLPGHPDYRPYVRKAVPFMVGDSFAGRRLVGTSPQMFGCDDSGQLLPVGERFEYRRGVSYELAAGRVFAPCKFEAVIGSEVASSLHLKLYDPQLSEDENEKTGGAFRATHGLPAPTETPDIHKPRWRIVGILKPTHTANDRVLFIPFVSLYAIAEHEEGMVDQALLRAGINPAQIPSDRINEVLQTLGIDPKKVPDSLKKKIGMKSAATSPAGPAAAQDISQVIANARTAPATETHEEEDHEDAYHLDERGDIVPDLPPEEWALSAILVDSRGGFPAQQLMYNFKVIDDRATACNPATVMRGFFDTFLAGSTRVLLLISALVTLVAAASIMTTIYNSISARQKEIAILRALGATRRRILSLICFEAVLIGALGGILGLLTGHLLSAAGSVYLKQLVGEGIDWFHVAPLELAYLAAVAVLALVAGLVPALKAYRTSVAVNLVTG